MRYETIIAWKQLLHRKGNGFISLISFISVAGIAVGVMALIVVLSVMSGFDTELKSKIIGANPHVIVLKSEGIDKADEVVRTIEALQVPGVMSVAPYVEGQSIIRSSTNATGAIVRGLSPDDQSIGGIEKYVKAGSLQSLFEPTMLTDEEGEPVGAIALGYQLARTLGIARGDRIVVIVPTTDGERSLLKKNTRMMSCSVVALFDFGMNTMDTTMALMPIEQAQALYNLKGVASGVAIRLQDEFSAPVVKEKVHQVLGYPYWVQTWIDMNRTFFAALQVEKNVMAILLSLIILVAGFNIISTLIMVVMEKTRDIGILKALGAHNRSIMWIFLLQGTIVGVVGVVTGALLGIVFTLNLNTIAAFIKQTTGYEVFPSDIYYFSRIPAELNMNDVIVIVVSALVISMLAGLYPARKAARLHPVEALRYE